MEKQALYSRESGITKNPFHKNKKPVNVNEVDIKRITLSNKKSYGNEDLFKTFTGFRHKGNAFPAPLCIKISQMKGCSKYFDKNNKHMNLLVNVKKY